jgi:DNA uptake protein ComE-like DNA-binding protein
MNQAVVRDLSAVLLAFACAVGSPAQEEVPKPKQPPSKAAQDAKTKAWEKKAKARAKADAAARARAVDINHASQDALKKVPGMTDAYVNSIIAHRPYKSKAELVTKNAIPLDYYQTIRKLVAVK